MKKPLPAEAIEPERRMDEPLVRSLYALLTEASVSQAAAKLGIGQPALSRHLKALRQLTGDELLVRVGNRMVLTERAQALLAPTRRILSDLSVLISEAKRVELADLHQSFRIAAYDFLPNDFFADFVERVRRQAPHCDLVIRGLGSRFEHYRQLGDGEVDMVITIWPELPAHLRAASLLTEPMVCLMRRAHPLANGPLTLDDYRRAQHLTSLEHVPGQGSILDAQLAVLGVSVHTSVRTQFLSLAPAILSRTDLIFSTGRALAEDFASRHPLVILPFPAKIKPHYYRLVWHERTHKNQALAWLRGELVAAARSLAHRPRA